MKLEDMTLEAKVDELLKYQRKLHRTAVIRAVFSFLTFLALVVLPIVGLLYVRNYILNTVGLSLEEIGEILKKVKTLTNFEGVENGIRSFFN